MGQEGIGVHLSEPQVSVSASNSVSFLIWIRESFAKRTQLELSRLALKAPCTLTLTAPAGFATVQTNMNLLLYSIIYIYYQNTFLVEWESINNCTIAKIKCTTMVSRLIINRINHQSVFCY